MNESDQEWGVGKHPFVACLREGIPAVSTKSGKSPFLVRLYPFSARRGLAYPGLAQNTTGGDGSSSWLLWHDETTASHVEKTKRSDPLKRDQHT